MCWDCEGSDLDFLVFNGWDSGFVIVILVIRASENEKIEI